MDIDKATIDSLIEKFKKVKDEPRINPRNLEKFDLTKKIDRQFLSYVHGVGGYYVSFLNFLIKETKPKNVVELGSWSGLSTLAMGDAVEETDSQFYTIDLLEDQRYCPPHMFKEPNIHFLYGDVCSREIISRLPRSIDLMFTDTLHFKYQFEDEFEIYQHLFSDQALIAVDDIKQNDKGDFFDSLPYAKWDLTELCHGSGWGLFLYTRKKDPTIDQEEAIKDALITVWERKYNRLYAMYSSQVTFTHRIKEKLKKITPLYKLYTKTFNAVHRLRKSKKMLSYYHKGRV